MDKLKILHVINNLGSGGAEKLLDDMLPRLNKDANLQVELLLLTDQNNVFDSNLKKEGVRISVIKLRNPRNPLNIFYIREFIKKGNFDIVHSHLFPTLYWVAFASMGMNKNKPKLVYTEHSTYNRRRDKSYLKILEKIVYHKYDKVICISKATKFNLIKWLNPRDKEKFIVINNGIDLDKFKFAKPYKKQDINSKFTDDTKLICMVGSFTPSKDQDTIIRAMESLSSNIHLILVGEGPLMNKSKNLAMNLGVYDRVHFLGFRSDIDGIIKTCDVIVQSSNWEGFGLVAVEAMAAGKIVLASDVTGLREVIGGKKLLFGRGNEKELEILVNRILVDKRISEEYRDECLNRSKHYSLETMIIKMIDLYKSIIEY